MKKTYKISLAVIVTAIVVAVITRDTPAQKEVKYIKRGIEFFEKGEYRKARIEYQNAAKIKPTDPEIGYRWGLADEAEGDFRNAFTNYSIAEQQSPHFHPALMKVALYYLAAEQYDEAQKRIDTVLTDSPGDPEAHALEAALLLRKKDFAGTEKEARFALSKDAANITAISVLTGLYSAQGNLEKAGDTVNEGISHNPKELSLLLLKAKLYEEPLNLPKINEAYQAIFKLKPNDTQYRIALSEIYINDKKIDEAEGILRSGITDLPDDWNIKHELIRFLGNHRDMQSAEKEVQGYMKENPKNDDLYFWLADLYINHNDTDKAVALLEQVVAKNDVEKKSLNAQTSLAHIHFVRGNKELAEKMVNAVLAKTPSNSDALFIRANLAIDQGLYQNAVSDLRVIIRDHPQAKDALQLLSEVLLLQGYTDLAIETTNQLVDIDPGNSAIRVRLAQMYHTNGDSRRALDLLAYVTKSEPNYPIGWESTARIAIDLKDWTAARAAIHNLDAIEGQHMTATFLEGQISAHTEKNDDAVSSYTKVIDADPSSPLAEHALYSLVEAQHSPKDLETTAKYIAGLKTDSPYVSTLLGQCYLQLGKTDLATAAFDKAIANHSAVQEPYIDRANIYMHDNKTDEALEILKKAVTIAPTDMRASLIQGDILSKLTRYKEAIALYEDLLNRNAKLDLAANNLASIIADHEYTDPAMLGKAQEAAERFSKSTDPFLLDTLGWVYFRQGKLKEALAIMARATASSDKTSPEIHYHYGTILQKAGKIEEAKAELQQATAKDANYPGLEDAKKMLGGL